MTLGVRQRIVLTLLVVGLFVAGVVVAGLKLMEQLEEHVPEAVREKTDRVLAIEALGSDFNRIDASFATALNGSSQAARGQYQQIWRELDEKLADAERNADPVERLAFFTQITRLANDYRRQGDGFYAQSESATARQQRYYGPHGLLETLEQLKKYLTDCFRAEQENMTTSLNEAHILVVNSLLSVEVMMGVTLVLAGLAAGYKIRTILRPNRPVVSAASDADPIAEPNFFGPICLCLVSIWLVVVFAWNTFTYRPPSASVAAAHTQTGAEIYRPEYDIPIYVTGLTIAVLIAVGWALIWHRTWQAASSDRRRRDIAWLLKIHKWFAIGSIAVATVFPNGRLLNVYCAVLAGLAAIILRYEAWAGRTENASTNLTTGTRLQRRPSTGSRARQGNRATSRAQLATHSGNPEVAETIDSERAHRSRVGRWATLSAIGIVTLLVYVPNASTLVWAAWTERFRHWNYYFVGPFINFQHGAAFGTQCYTQYGVGWPLIVSAITRFHPPSYEWLLQSASVYGCVYFVLLFCFLQTLTGRTAWAFAGLFLSLFLQMFSGTDWPIWATPSSTILRAPLDLLVYWFALKHARSGDPRWGFLIGGAAGLCLLFGNDTGVYVIAAVMFYVALCWGYHPSGKRLFNISFARNNCVALIATFLGGLCWASRGTCFQRGFWPLYWESILLYSGGMSSLPMKLGIERPQEFVLLITALTTYSFAIAVALFRFIIRKLEATDLVLALVAASGLGMLILFINRSHPFNVYHPIIPFCILASYYCSQWKASATSASAETQIRSWRRRDAVPMTIIAVLLVALASNRHFRTYPSLLATLLPSFALERAVTPGPLATVEPGQKASVGYREDLRPLVETLQRLSDGGRHSVAVVAQADTLPLFLADVAPYFRYSPLELLDKRQVDLVEQAIIDHPPDFVLFCNAWPIEMRRDWERFLGERYQKESQVQDGWFILARVQAKR